MALLRRAPALERLVLNLDVNEIFPEGAWLGPPLLLGRPVGSACDGFRFFWGEGGKARICACTGVSVQCWVFNP